MNPGNRLPSFPGDGLMNGDGVGFFKGDGNPNPGDGVGVANCGDGRCIFGRNCGPVGLGDGVFDGGTIPRGACGLSNRMGKFNVGNGDACLGAGADGPGAASLGP